MSNTKETQTVTIACPNHPSKFDQSKADQARQALADGKTVVFLALMGSCQCGDLGTTVRGGDVISRDGEYDSYGRGRIMALAGVNS